MTDIVDLYAMRDKLYAKLLDLEVIELINNNVEFATSRSPPHKNLNFQLHEAENKKVLISLTFGEKWDDDESNIYFNVYCKLEKAEDSRFSSFQRTESYQNATSFGKKIILLNKAALNWLTKVLIRGHKFSSSHEN